MPQMNTVTDTLSKLALKRRDVFNSKEEAWAVLGSKQPFKDMHPEAFRLYIDHGLRPFLAVAASDHSGTGQDSQHTVNSNHHVAAAVTKQPSQFPGSLTSSSSSLENQTYGADTSGRNVSRDPILSNPSTSAATGALPLQWTLKCTKHIESKHYWAFHPPPAVDPGRVTCPITFGFSKLTSAGVHSHLPWLNHHLALALPRGRAECFDHLGHFGPLEDPVLIGKCMSRFFSEVLEGHFASGNQRTTDTCRPGMVLPSARL